MQQIEILNHDDLLERIKGLRLEKTERESELITSIKIEIESFDQMKVIKRYIQEIASDNEIKSNLAKIGINIGVKFLVNKFFSSPQNETVPGYIQQFKKMVIQNATPRVVLGFQNFLQRKRTHYSSEMDSYEEL